MKSIHCRCVCTNKITEANDPRIFTPASLNTLINARRLYCLQSIVTYIRGTSQYPLVVVGESGSGKTSIMAMAARNAWGIHNGNAAVIYR